MQRSFPVTRHGGVRRIEAPAPKNRILGNSGSVEFTVKLDEASSARLTLLADDILGGPAEISTQKGDFRIAEAVTVQDVENDNTSPKQASWTDMMPVGDPGRTGAGMAAHHLRPARNANIDSVKVTGNHGSISRRGAPAVAEAVREIAALGGPHRTTRQPASQQSLES
ncbi:hypothetical protein [Streptomyces sp. WAC04114]|uniref:hypothetical protein n=1 Tax=Streptomyces sp. WAC04114 TaxID=2867961 RepID=UPI0021AB548A|nr:hypothetical protein [Streptomyces sp. WAC04114]